MDPSALECWFYCCVFDHNGICAMQHQSIVHIGTLVKHFSGVGERALADNAPKYDHTPTTSDQVGQDIVIVDTLFLSLVSYVVGQNCPCCASFHLLGSQYGTGYARMLIPPALETVKRQGLCLPILGTSIWHIYLAI